SGGSGSCTSTSGNCTCDAVANPPTNCAAVPNQPGCVTFQADFRVLLTAQTRYDIGMYIATDGDLNGNGALTGQCFDSVITNTNNTTNFTNLDPAPDVCGDITNDSTHNPQIVKLVVSTACVGDQNGK